MTPIFIFLIKNPNSKPSTIAIMKAISPLVVFGFFCVAINFNLNLTPNLPPLAGQALSKGKGL